MAQPIADPKLARGLVTVQCSKPGERYALLDGPPSMIVHLAPALHGTGGTGRCICGFDRFAEKIGFSVGGGITGPAHVSEPCSACVAALAGPWATFGIHGTHAALFEGADRG